MIRGGRGHVPTSMKTTFCPTYRKSLNISHLQPLLCKDFVPEFFPPGHEVGEILFYLLSILSFLDFGVLNKFLSIIDVVIGLLVFG